MTALLMNFTPSYSIFCKAAVRYSRKEILVSSKIELENLNFCPSLLGQKFLVRFLEELETPRSPFEII